MPEGRTRPTVAPVAFLVPLAASTQTLGNGGSVATDSAGPNGAVNANSQFERCDAPKGTLVQQSNCFQVVALRHPGGSGRRQRREGRLLARRRASRRRGAAAGGYGDTNEGKMIAASFVDHWNNIVRAITPTRA